MTRLFLVAALSVAAFLFTQQPLLAQNAFTPDRVKWGPAPPFIPAGAQLAVLEGDPMAASGDYTIRLKMPDGYKVPAHFHPADEAATVISGSFNLGMGDKLDTSKTMELQPGGFAYAQLACTITLGRRVKPSCKSTAMDRSELPTSIRRMIRAKEWRRNNNC